MTAEIDCELVRAARILALQRGLNENEIECPFIDICKGTICHLLVCSGFQIPEASWEAEYYAHEGEVPPNDSRTS